VDSPIIMNNFGLVISSCILIAALNASLPLPLMAIVPWRTGSQVHVHKDALICRAWWTAWIIHIVSDAVMQGCVRLCNALELTSPAADALLQQFRLQTIWVDRFTHVQARLVRWLN